MFAFISEGNIIRLASDLHFDLVYTKPLKQIVQEFSSRCFITETPFPLISIALENIYRNNRVDFQCN